MGRTISNTELSDTLTLSECSDGYWLWDATREMNLAVKAKSSTDAFVEALHYYQERLTAVEQKHRDMSAKVEAFVSQFVDEEKEE